jgi:hypothetical protein
MNSRGPERKIFLSLFVLVLVFFISSLPWLFYKPDDLYIHLRFARNLAQSGEWSFNPGEPVAGATSPPWVALLSLAGFLPIGPVAAAKTLGILTGVLLLWTVYAFLLKARIASGFALLIASALAASHWLSLWSASGMETPLSPLFLVAALGLSWLGRKRLCLAGICLGFATIARADAIPAALVILCGSLIYLSSRERLRLLVPFVLVAFSWPLFSKLTLGSWLPLTVRAKAGRGLDIAFFPKAALRTGLVAASEMLPFLVLLALAVILDRDVRRRWKLWLFPFAAGMAYPLGYFWNGLRSGVEASGRYLVPWFVLLVLACALAIAPWLTDARRKKWVVLAASLAIVQSVTVAVSHRPAVLRYDAYHKRTLMEAANWLRQNAGPRSTVVAGDIGVIGFFGNVHVLDIFGIINPEAPRWAAEGKTFEALAEKMPDYVINPAWAFPFDMTRLEPYTKRIIFSHEHRDYRWTWKPGTFTVTFREMRWPEKAGTAGRVDRR